MNFGSRSEKVSRRIAQMEAALTGRVDDPAVQRPLRQTRTRKPFPESLLRDEKRLSVKFSLGTSYVPDYIGYCCCRHTGELAGW